MPARRRGVEFPQAPEDDLGITGDADLHGIVAHKILFIMGQEDLVLIDDPGIARLAGAHPGSHLFTDEDRIQEKFHHPGKYLVPSPIKGGEETHDPAPLPGGIGIVESLAQKEAAAMGRVTSPPQISGRQRRVPGRQRRGPGAKVLHLLPGGVVAADIQDAEAPVPAKPFRHDVVQLPLLGQGALKQSGIAHEGVLQKVEIGVHIVANLPGQHQLLLVELVFQDNFYFQIEFLPGGIEEKGEDRGDGQDEANGHWQGDGSQGPAGFHLGIIP